MPIEYPCTHNQLLAALNLDNYRRISPYFDFVSLKTGEILYLAGETMEHAYFPLTSMISLVSIMEDGSTTEISLVGNEGMVGLPIVLGGGRALNQAVVQIKGTALRIDGSVLKREFDKQGRLHHLLLLYTQARLIQVSQNAACNRQHSIEKRLARWLLSAQDGLRSCEVPLTQEFIANMLGIRRSGVTVAAQNLQNLGVIKYSRGHITILNEMALQEMSCECYRVVQREYLRLLGIRRG